MNIYEKPILTFDEAALYTGLQKSYLYKLTSQRIIPHSKPGGKKIFFERTVLEQWMLSAKVESIEDAKENAAKYEIRSKKSK